MFDNYNTVFGFQLTVDKNFNLADEWQKKSADSPRIVQIITKLKVSLQDYIDPIKQSPDVQIWPQ